MMTERLLLAAYLRARRAFGRAPGDPEARSRSPLLTLWINYIAAGEDLLDWVRLEGEVESRKHLVRLGPDSELRVVRWGRVARVRPSRLGVPRAA